jgi:hypothetical protein
MQLVNTISIVVRRTRHRSRAPNPLGIQISHQRGSRFSGNAAAHSWADLGRKNRLRGGIGGNVKLVRRNGPLKRKRLGLRPVNRLREKFG